AVDIDASVVSFAATHPSAGDPTTPHALAEGGSLMISHRLHAIVLVLIVAAAPAYAQEASIVGTVVDQSKAVLPGATITATNLDTGRQFTGTTDERGEYRLHGVTPGRFKVQAELAGFTTALIPQVDLL